MPTTTRGRLARRAVVLALALAPVLAASGPAGATAPGRNGDLVFNRGGNIWTSAWDGSRARPLTTWPGGGGGWPKWSPDGTTISYTRGGHVWTMKADGTGHRRLFPGMQASWSRDGTWLAYAGTDDYDLVQVRRLAAGPAITVEPYSDSGGCPYERRPGPSTSWTADGNVVYGVVENGGTSPGCPTISSYTSVQKAPPAEAYELPPSTGRLTSWRSKGSSPTVDAAPTGSGYVLATTAGQRDGLARLYVGAGTTRRQLTQDRGVHAPAFSPDGRWVLYTQHLPGGPWVTKRVLRDGSAPPVVVLAQGSQADSRPVR